MDLRSQSVLFCYSVVMCSFWIHPAPGLHDLWAAQASAPPSPSLRPHRFGRNRQELCGACALPTYRAPIQDVGCLASRGVTFKNACLTLAQDRNLGSICSMGLPQVPSHMAATRKVATGTRHIPLAQASQCLLAAQDRAKRRMAFPLKPYASGAPTRPTSEISALHQGNVTQGPRNRSSGSYLLACLWACWNVCWHAVNALFEGAPS